MLFLCIAFSLAAKESEGAATPTQLWMQTQPPLATRRAAVLAIDAVDVGKEREGMNKRQVQAVLELTVVLGLFAVVVFGSGGARAFALVALLIAFVVYRRQR